jgi:hypothetical protein
MKNQLLKIIFGTHVIAFVACEKEITVDLPQPNTKICVEGKIEPGVPAFVYLTKNAPYFAETDLNAIQQYIVKNAFVTITDGYTTDTLTEVFPNQGYLYAADNMLGVVGRTYTITIVAEGKTITATTTIPQPVPLDSLWFKTALTTNDSLGFIWATLSEPVGSGNAYRWYAKRINKDADFVPPFGSVFDDKFIEGQTFDFAYNRGAAPNSSAIDDSNAEHGYFKTNDTVVIKFCVIDQAAFLFYRSLETELSNNGNPFASPSPVKTNFTPRQDALGIFCGFGVWTDTLITQ